MESYQSILLDQLRTRQLRNPTFSLRAFARFLETSPSHLSSLINGRKKLTAKMASKLIEKLALSESENEALTEALISKKNSLSALPSDLKLLKEDEFSLISEWYHLAILSLGKLKNKADAKWIADQLGIEPMVAHQAFHRLRRLGLVKVQDGQFQQVGNPLDTTTDIPSKAIRSYHSQNLQLAAEKLESVPVEKREFSTITMALDPEQLVPAKKMINEFKHKFCKKVEGTSNSAAVYTLAIQFFPLTKDRGSL